MHEDLGTQHMPFRIAELMDDRQDIISIKVKPLKFPELDRIIEIVIFPMEPEFLIAIVQASTVKEASRDHLTVVMVQSVVE